LFEKVHGQEHDDPNWAKEFKRNVVDKDQHDVSKTVGVQFKNVTGHWPGDRIEGDEDSDDLQVFCNRIQNAGDKIIDCLHQRKLQLGVGNAYIVKFG